MEKSADTPTQILVVEDDAPLAMLVEQMIAEWGYAAVICVRGEDAVETARVIRPELVLMDVKLKGEMTGLEAAEAIKAEIGCPVAFMTAYGDPETARRMRQIAGSNVLGKPISKAILRMTVRHLLSAQGRRTH